MACVAGVNGSRGGWAVVIKEEDRWRVREVAILSELVDSVERFDIIAVDIPIGLCDAYEIGGRACDREARKYLRSRASSVFPAPVRPVLTASSWEEACARSRASGPFGKGVTKQTFAIVPKIKEADDLLQARPELRDIIREVHPEVCFCELAGRPMSYPKRKHEGQNERLHALRHSFRDMDVMLKAGRDRGLRLDDILDAKVACWSADRLAVGKGRSLMEPVPRDSTGLPMTIWV
jgi:predicted RNase H-like nuclease